VKVFLRTALLVATVAIAASTGGQSIAQEQDCTGQVFLYDGTGYSGQLWCFPTTTEDVGVDVTDTASSAFNETTAVVELFSEPFFAGPSICLEPGTGVDDLSSVGLDNTISSVSVGSCTVQG